MVRRADTESGGRQMYPATQFSSPRGLSRKSLLVLVMFMARAAFLIFFVITIMGIGSSYLIFVALIILLVDLALTALIKVTGVIIRIKKGMRPEGT